MEKNLMAKNLKELSHQQLLEGAKQLVSRELEIGLQLLEYLREIEAQLIFAELGFDSMWSFCVTYLGLSEGDAQRKLATMRLCRAIPEVREDISQGKISMTNAAKVQTFFNAEKRAGKDLSLERKKEVLQSVHCLSKTECEKKLIELSPASAIPAERLRPLTQEHTELKVVLDSETLGVLDQLKDLLAHTLGDASYQTLIQHMANETLKRVKKSKGLETVEAPTLTQTPNTAMATIKGKESKEEKAQKAKDKRGEKAGNEAREAEREAASLQKKPPQGFATLPLSLPGVLPSPTDTPPPPVARTSAGHKVALRTERQAIPLKIRRMIFHRAKGRCEYVSPDGKRCGSQHRLEINHKNPVAWGGSNNLSNLELTCRSHNLLHAQHALGRDWMERFR